jgi:hypothetical protein
MRGFDARLKALEARRDAGRPLFVSSLEATDVRARLWAKLGVELPKDAPPCRGFRLGTPEEEEASKSRVLEKLKAFVREGEDRFPQLALDATKASIAARLAALG